MMKQFQQITKLSLATCLALALPAIAQQGPYPSPSGNFSLPAQGATYADFADLVTNAPMIIDVKIRKAKKVPDSQAAGVPAGLQRTLVTADTIALLRGQGGVAGQIQFLLDIPRDARGKFPKIKKQRFFLFARPVGTRKDMVQLIRPDAVAAYSPENDSQIRAITIEALKLNAPQAITGIASAFHSAGTIVGEGETQIFLNTAKGQPFGMTVTSINGQKNWNVSTSEIISDAEEPPAKNTLLWYRLACGLPAELPANLVGGQNAANVTNAQNDYRFVKTSLGACERTRTPM